jgi:hypothetical protein
MTATLRGLLKEAENRLLTRAAQYGDCLLSRDREGAGLGGLFQQPLGGTETGLQCGRPNR